MSTWTPEMKAAGEQVRARIYRLIVDNPGISSHTITQLLDMPLRTAAGHLSILSIEGRVSLKRGAQTTRLRPRSVTRVYPTAHPEPRAVNRGGHGKEIPMPDDAEHRAWMAYWQVPRATRKADVIAMRSRV